jgi:hydrogenase maturation protein HypF
MNDHTAHIRRRVRVRGIVQGVGFRPWVYRLAVARDLSGFVLNDADGVVVEVQGPATIVDDFVAALGQDVPPMADITAIETEDIPPAGDDGFTIRSSEAGWPAATQVAPDMAICDACLGELLDPVDRRHRYPFINCTHCGPRYSIILDVPYDRPRTTMQPFTMCPACQREYDDPTDRRFHAQPNACPVCGPRLSLFDAGGKPLAEDDAIEAVRARLLSGDIVAIKGLTGYHLACDARNEAVVAELRRRKHRDEKPLALMVADIAVAERLVHLDDASRELLESPERPIVLAPRRTDAEIALSVAPRSRYLGLMLPYAPLHYLLFADGFPPMVMTSANLSEEPMCRENTEVFERLGDIADAFLLHDRGIRTICDDSVATAQLGEPLVIRRARGYAPRPIRLSNPAPADVILATGAELKNCVCLTRGGDAYVSQHIGDLKNPLAVRYFEETIEKLQTLLEVRPAVIAHDMHPAYQSTRYAQGLEGVRLTAVQHHHAHIASIMAEHHQSEPVIGLSADGTGYGTDGHTWGCEFLAAHTDGTFDRLGHLDYLPLPGGDAAVQHVERIAWAALVVAFGDKAEAVAERHLPGVTGRQRLLWRQMIDRNINAPLACGLGRLFDAISALCGVTTRSTYEGQAAIELEAVAAPDTDGQFAYNIMESADGSPFRVDWRVMIRDLVRALDSGLSPGEAAAWFHNTVVAFVLDGLQRCRKMTGLDRVAFSGGCMLNARLVEHLAPALASRGFTVYRHRQVSPGDGGVALGQVEVARQRLVAGTL